VVDEPQSLLIDGLDDYQRSLDNHLRQLMLDFEALERQWHVFNTVYEGDAAAQFRRYWLRTLDHFREYFERAERIGRLLEEHVDDLKGSNPHGTD
jgi:hypothetical protein